MFLHFSIWYRILGSQKRWQRRWQSVCHEGIEKDQYRTENENGRTHQDRETGNYINPYKS